MDHYEVFRTVQVQEVRRKVAFMWAFYQVEGRPLEGTHFLGLDWAYSLDMKVSFHRIIFNMKLCSRITFYYITIKWYCSIYFPKVTDTGMLDILYWWNLRVRPVPWPGTGPLPGGGCVWLGQWTLPRIWPYYGHTPPWY